MWVGVHILDPHGVYKIDHRNVPHSQGALGGPPFAAGGTSVKPKHQTESGGIHVLHTRNKLTKTRIVTAAVLVITTMGVGTFGTAIQASAVAIPLPISVVQQQSGHTTGVTFDNHSVTPVGPAGPFGFPASVGDTVTVSFAGVTKADGTQATDDAGVLGAGGYLAAFCGNFTQGRVGGDVALTGADVSSIEGIDAHCGPLTPVSSVAGTLTVSNLLLTVPGEVIAAPAILAGSITPAVAAVAPVAPVAAIPANPPATIPAVPATLFTPFVPEVLIGSISAAVPAVLEVLEVIGVPADPLTTTPAVLAAEGTQCVGNNTVIPCLLIVASLDQSVALAMPVVNASAVSVVGRVGLFDAATGLGVCNPSSLTAPPSTCPAARLTTGPATAYPVIFGGQGFIPSDNNLAPTPGANATALSLKVCSSASNAACLPGVASAAGPLGVSSTGATGGAIVISPAGGVTPGDRFLQVTGRHEVFTGGACPAGFAAEASSFNPALPVCQLTQTYYTAIKILAAAASTPAFTPGSGAPGTVGVLNGSSYEPRANVSIQRRDVNGKLVGAPLTTTTNGTGDLSYTFAAGALDYPVADVVVTTTDAAFGAAQTTQTVVFDSAGAIAFCSNGDACNVGELITVAVLPGNVQMSAGDATVEIDAVDLSTIDITDPESWYPESAPGAITQVLIGDMRGANAGFVITGSVSDLRGATQASNIIPAVDVFMEDSVVCDVYADAGDGNDPLGAITAGAGQAPFDNQGASLLADGSQEFCTVGPDGDGRAAGMFTLDAALVVAGRPITAVDDYVGLLTLTITGN